MKANLLSPDKDPMGQLLPTIFTIRRQENYVYSHLSLKKMKIPINQLFRSFDEMSEPEKTALQMAAERFWMPVPEAVAIPWHCKKWERKFAPLTISPALQSRLWQNAVYVMSVKINLFDVGFLETFDTILMLMNGSGIIGKLGNMPDFFLRMKQLLRPGGCILMDSSDLRYLFEDEDGSFLDRPCRRLLWRN